MNSPLEVVRARSLRGGVKRSFTPALAAGAMVQYTRDHEKIRGVLQDYHEFNAIYVINNSDALVAVDLDFCPEKRQYYPAHTMLGDDQLQYLEFQVVNLESATAVTEGQLIVTAINERPLAREVR